MTTTTTPLRRPAPRRPRPVPPRDARSRSSPARPAAPHHVADVRGHAGPRVPGAQPERTVHFVDGGQPLLWVFVFTYVMPKIGAAGVFEAGAARGGGTTFSTILLPGLMASMLLMQGILGTTFPLVMEFSWQRTIEDRALAPVPLSVLAFEKIVAGAVQAFVGALIVIPIVLFVHASGQSPHAHVTNWFMLALILVAASMLTAALGLLLGTLMDPRKMQMLFAVILLPATMLGCVYYPGRRCTASGGCRSPCCSTRWCTCPRACARSSPGGRSPWPTWAILLVLVGGAVVVGYLGTRTFSRRVLN